MKWRVIVVASLLGLVGVPSSSGAAGTVSEAATVPMHCVMPITPTQVSEFDVDLLVDLTVTAPTAGESVAIDASVRWTFAPNPTDFVVTLGNFDLSLAATGAVPSDLRVVGPEQVLPTGATTVNPIAELQTTVEVAASPGERLVLAARRFSYTLRINGGGPLVSCTPIGGPIELYSAIVLAPVADNCKGMANTITGTNHDDVIVGTAGDDVVNVGAGNDRVFGLDGNDVICGSHGADEIMGGGGNDRLYGEGGRDTLLGGAGADVVHGGGQIDACQSGALTACESSVVAHPTRIRMTCRAWLSRNPPLYQDFFLDVGVRVATSARPEVGRRLALDTSIESQLFSISGIDPGSVSAHLVGTGADPLSIFATGDAESDVLSQPIAEAQVDSGPSGAAGTAFGYNLLNLNYTLSLPGGGSTGAGCSPVTPPATVLHDLASSSTTTCKGLAPTIVGTAHDDVIIGTAGADVVQAGSGDDVVFGLGGDDRICGSHGDDVVLGGSGEDHLYGEGGNDSVLGGANYDWVHGGGNVDRCASGLPVSCETVDT